MNKSAHNQKGSVLFVAITVVAIAGVALLFLQSRQNRMPVLETSPTLPPESERLNATPDSLNTLVVGDIDPGDSVVVKNATLSEAGYVQIFMDASGEPGKLLGKSELLEMGTHESIEVSLSSAVTDGDVVIVGLYNSKGAKLEDSEGNSIYVQKNVGMPMGHYDPSEY